MINRYASLRQGLVGCWIPSLGASGFRLIDRSGYGNHGTLTNMDPGTDWVPSGGKLALDFDGVNDFVRVNTTYTQNAISMSVWINIRAATLGFPYPMHLGTTDAVVAGIGSDANSTNIRWVLNDSGTLSICDLSASNPANAMSHFCGTWNGSTAALYRNGDLVASTTSTRTLGTQSNALYIGALSGGRSIFGQLDDARIYNRALTPSEIRLLYTGGRGVGLVPERIKHRRKTTAAASNRRRRIICGANC